MHVNVEFPYSETLHSCNNTNPLYIARHPGVERAQGGVGWAATPRVVGRYSEIERGDSDRVGCSCGGRGSDIEFYVVRVMLTIGK